MKKFLFIENRFNRLAKRMQHGDERAARELYGELASKVFGFCLSRVRERYLAEDLSQEIFLKLVTGIHTFDSTKGDFTVWFWRLARNTVIDYYRREKSLPFADIGDDTRIESLAQENPEGNFAAKFEKQQLDEFLKTLSREEQELFELRYLGELSYKEISDITEKSDGALRVAMSRVKKKIRDHFA